MRGQPQTVSALTTASTDDVLAVLYVEADPANVGEIMRRMLARFASEAVLLFDPNSKRIIGTTDAATAQALRDLWTANAFGETRVQPRSGQAGVLMLYEATDDGLNIGDTLANAIQRRTFYGLVNTALGLWEHQSPAQPPPAVLVDQPNAQIAFAFADLSGLDAIPPGGQTVCVQFAPNPAKHIFE